MTPDSRDPDLGGEALAVLLGIMKGSDSDSVRVAAAKVVLARAAEEEQAMRRPDKDDEKQRRAAIDAIARLLDELAAARAASHGGETALAEDSAPGADHAAG